MTVAITDFSLMLSGGAANADPSLSLGGIESSSNVIAGGLNSIFRDILSTEASSGLTLYRGLYLRNNNLVDTASNIVMFVNAPTTSVDSNTSFGVGTALVNGTEQVIASETTAPTGVVLTSPTTLATGVALGNLGPGESRSLWVALTVAASAGFQIPDAVTWRFTFNP